MIVKNCLYCNKEYSRKKGWGFDKFAESKFCSQQCSAKWHSGENNPRWNGGKHKCTDCGIFLKDFYSKRCVPCFRLFNHGENNPLYKGERKCIDCGAKIARSDAKRCKKCFGKTITGEKNYHWKGGTKQRYELGFSYETKAWAKSVYAKDHYTCAMCHKHCSKDIQAHHILSWKDAPELRLEVNNGITLCFDCHLTTRGREAYLAPLFYNVLATRQSDRFVWSN